MKKISFSDFQTLSSDGFRKINNEIINSNIKWWAHSGTLIGIVRYKKIIPWDDDIDMTMSIYDFYKYKKELIQIANNNNYYLVDRMEIRGMHICRFIYKEKFKINFENKYYINSPFIDIMLSVGVKKSNKVRSIIWTATNNYLFVHNSFLNPLPFYKKKNFKVKKITKIEKTFVFTMKILLWPSIIAILLQKKWLDKKKKTDSKILAMYYRYNTEGIVYNKNELIALPFYDEKIFVSRNYQKELEIRFGKNWINEPPINEQKPKHIILTPYNKKINYKIYPFIIK
ncbi:MAG: hypothetical protein GQ557_00560 [Mycoplasmataceae bacterium]|nr:hypothetical protein [Mycoplasmataceae bacterium]